MKNFYENVEKMPEGYYRLKTEYRKNLADFYKDEYFQQEHATYSSKYEECEKVYFGNEAKEKDFVARKISRLAISNGGGDYLTLDAAKATLLRNFHGSAMRSPA